MTLLVAWIGKDDKPQGKETSSLYIGSDSRYSWQPGTKRFDCGPKTYACSTSPNIFGFCGDVTFCTTVIPQIKDRIDSNTLFEETSKLEERQEKIKNFIATSIAAYPSAILTNFEILYGTRIGQQFSLLSYEFSKKDKELKVNSKTFPAESNIVHTTGTGKETFENYWTVYDAPKADNSKTSRNIYHILSESIKNNEDRATGGYPQVVGLYRGGNARVFGIVTDGKLIISGKEDAFTPALAKIEWRNDKFERVDVTTQQLLEGAQPHYFKKIELLEEKKTLRK